jgi:hypothetical protein
MKYIKFATLLLLTTLIFSALAIALIDSMREDDEQFNIEYIFNQDTTKIESTPHIETNTPKNFARIKKK